MKKVISLILTAVMALSLSACGEPQHEGLLPGQGMTITTPSANTQQETDETATTAQSTTPADSAEEKFNGSINVTTKTTADGYQKLTLVVKSDLVKELDEAVRNGGRMEMDICFFYETETNPLQINGSFEICAYNNELHTKASFNYYSVSTTNHSISGDTLTFTFEPKGVDRFPTDSIFKLSVTKDNTDVKIRYKVYPDPANVSNYTLKYLYCCTAQEFINGVTSVGELDENDRTGYYAEIDDHAIAIVFDVKQTDDKLDITIENRKNRITLQREFDLSELSDEGKMDFTMMGTQADGESVSCLGTLYFKQSGKSFILKYDIGYAFGSESSPSNEESGDAERVDEEDLVVDYSGIYKALIDGSEALVFNVSKSGENYYFNITNAVTGVNVNASVLESDFDYKGNISFTSMATGTTGEKISVICSGRFDVNAFKGLFFTFDIGYYGSGDNSLLYEYSGSAWL